MERGGRVWFATGDKSFESVVEEVGKRLEGSFGRDENKWLC